MITLTNEWIEEEKKEGVVQGIKTGQIRFITKQLACKFSADVAELLRPTLELLCPEDPEDFGVAVLDFNTPAEAEAWLGNANKASQ
jgi:hypothetical protein